MRIRNALVAAVMVLPLGTWTVIAAPAVSGSTVDDSSNAASSVAFVVQPKSAQVDHLSAAEKQDIAASAEGDGLSVAAAEAQFGWQASFAEVVDTLRARFSGSFSGAAIEDTGSARAWVAFTGEAPAATATLLTAVPVAVEVRAGAGFTESELAEQVTLAHYAVRDVVPRTSSPSLIRKAVTSSSPWMKNHPLHRLNQS